MKAMTNKQNKVDWNVLHVIVMNMLLVSSRFIAYHIIQSIAVFLKDLLKIQCRKPYK